MSFLDTLISNSPFLFLRTWVLFFLDVITTFSRGLLVCPWAALGKVENANRNKIMYFIAMYFLLSQFPEDLQDRMILQEDHYEVAFPMHEREVYDSPATCPGSGRTGITEING